MADPGEEKEIQTPKAVAESHAISIQSASESRGIDSDSEKAAHVSEKHDDEIGRVESRSDQEDDAPKEPLATTKSHATDASVVVNAAAEYAAKPWYKKLNPMRWGGIPEIPKERIVSREYQAGFFSRLTFYWMNPLMTVSFWPELGSLSTWRMRHALANLLFHRQDISASWISKTSGSSIQTERLSQ